MFHVPEKYRITENAGPYTTKSLEGNYGAFEIPSPEPGWLMLVLANDGLDVKWEHVSVSIRNKPLGNKAKVRTPTWKEMCYIKDLFWDDEDVVMQLHPRKSEYVNLHQHTLHLWHPLEQTIPEPPSILVGPKI